VWDGKQFEPRLILPLCVPLLITSVRKTEASAVSAELRGFHLRTRESCYKVWPLRAADFAVMAGSVLIASSAFIVNTLV
jgi:energy-coupling factor transport system permease protein